MNLIDITIWSDAVILFPMFGDGFAFNPPRYFTVFGLPIYFYGVIVAAGFLLAGLYALKRRADFGLTQDNVFDMLICAIVAGIVGARLYYVAFNASEFFGAGKWLNVFKVREGGLAVYGGIIAVVVTLVVYCRMKKVKLGAMLDVGGLGLLIGQAVGRWGNFFNREVFGAETALPWRMGLTIPTRSMTIFVHPAFLYESLWNALGFALLHFFSKKKRQYDGQIFLLYLLWYGIGRFMIEGIRADTLYIPGTALRVSQVLAGVCAVGSAAILARNYLKTRSRMNEI
jgi:phosphatidylglycerol:prolipoprotein diacylglycerol transferase